MQRFASVPLVKQAQFLESVLQRLSSLRQDIGQLEGWLLERLAEQFTPDLPPADVDDE